MNNTAIAYLRLSKLTKPEEDSLGFAAQRNAVDTFARANGLTITAYYTEVVSGGAALADRPILGEAIADVIASGASALLVAKRDRLSRDVLVSCLVEREIGPARVLAADGNNGDDPAGKFMRTMLDAFAEFERAMIGIRTKAALKAKRATGWIPGRPPGAKDAKPRKKRTDNYRAVRS